MMNDLFLALGRVLAWGFLVCGLALSVCVAAGPGDVVRVGVECEYSAGSGDYVWSTSGLDLALASVLCVRQGSPVYLAQGWARNQGLAAGMMVRAFVRVDGEIVLADGLQLSDGCVMVDGQAFERVDPP